VPPAATRVVGDAGEQKPAMMVALKDIGFSPWLATAGSRQREDPAGRFGDRLFRSVDSDRADTRRPAD